MSEAEKYDVLEKIGHGSFGVIRKVRRKLDGMILCRKEISYVKMSQKEREQLHVEFQILSTLRHPNIVGYYHRDHLKQSQDLHLYMEYCGGGDLGRVIRELAQKNQFAEEQFIWSIFSQLVTALYRCHYGLDPPPVGKNVLGLAKKQDQAPIPAGGITILHRDLKPENVFLGEEGSVKLGDFGLSKMIEAHDFASTYVGTPFYMSPEICAAEKYTLKSDIWSLGCIIYELCTREPPFNAKSHYQLIQKIKEGKFSPLPKIYSIELSSIIRDCLRTNPDHRPDTASLLNLPIVRLMRKEREVLDRNKAVKAREELLERKIAELEQRVLNADADRVNIRQEIDASLRREWEVKARLEIDRRVSIELEVLRKRFEDEVKVRVESELQMQKKTVAFVEPDAQELSSSTTKSDYPHSSIGAASAEEETSAITDITELSIDSPVEAPVSNGAAKKLNTRTPFGRAQTMFTNTPMDVEMGSPSPIAIASLALSPRRTAATKVPAANQPTIFGANGNGANNAHHEHLWHVHREPAGGDLDSDNDDGSIPSPRRLLFHTKAGSAKNPFTSRQRPVLHSQKTAPAAQAPTLGRLKSQPSLAAQAKSGASAAVSAMSSNPDFHTARSRDGSGGGGATTATATTNNNTGGGSRERAASPNRRLSKIPSAAALGDGALLLPPPLPQGGQPAQGLSRKPSLTGNGGNNRRGGLLEAAAAEGVSMHFTSKAAGGGIVLGAGASSSVAALTAGGAGGGGAAQGVKIAAQVRGRTLVELQQARAGGRGGGMMTAADLAGSPKRAFKERVMMAAAAQAAQGAENKEPPPVWDPDRDEMPSPFLVRKKPGVRQ